MATTSLPSATQLLESLNNGTDKRYSRNSGIFGSAPTTNKAKDYLASNLRGAVKGFGCLEPGRVVPLTDKKAKGRANTSLEVLRKITGKGLSDPAKVISNLRCKEFGQQLGTALSMDPMYQMRSALNEMGAAYSAFTGKSFTTSAPLSSGFVPFDLLPLVRLIYPVYTPLRNKIPRVPGQGTSHRAKILSSITGSQPGGLGSLQRDSIAELPAGGGIAGTNWPNQLPSSGSQTAYDLNVPYRFFGLTEAITWLAQFAGQGFDDIYGVASLVLLQEFMLLEERDNICATSGNLAVPAAPTVTARAAGSNETPVTGVTTNVYVQITALNYWGETSAFSGAGHCAPSSSDVVDVTITPVAAAIAYNIYVGTGASQGTLYLDATVGGIKYTIQGAIPTSGATPPVADTGTGSPNDPEGIITQLSGKSATNGVYPADALAGYYQPALGTALTTDAVITALRGMWDSKTGYLADPREIIVEGTDAANLAADVRESSQNYLLQVQQSEMASVTTGVAVAEIQNPITRSTVATAVHPYVPQGNAILMSYTLPQPQNNISNVVETVMVQDYVTIGWPVIDVTFRQSIFRYGLQAMLYAPQYCGLIQGIEASSTTPWS